MGPIERELREWPREHAGNDFELRRWSMGPLVSDGAFDLLLETGANMGFRGDWPISDAARQRRLPDLISEAIEAAEALGL